MESQRGFPTVGPKALLLCHVADAIASQSVVRKSRYILLMEEILHHLGVIKLLYFLGILGLKVVQDFLHQQ